MRRLLLSLAAAIALVGFVAACGDDGEEAGPSGTPTIHTLAPLASTAPEVDAEFTTLSDGLQIATVTEGEGKHPVNGDTVTVNYAGWLKDGALFDSSLKEGGSPFQFVVGAGRVIAGWDEGIKLMSVGGVYRLIIPPALGYGDRGSSSGSIPPNSTLVFDMSIVSSVVVPVTPTPSPLPTVNSTPPPLTSSPTTLPDGLALYTIEEGTGAQVAAHDTVTVGFTGWVVGGGQFEDTTVPGKPQFTFVVGEQKVIPGFDEGVALMKVGGKYRLVIPPAIAFGTSGSGAIPPNATVVFDITVTSSVPATPVP